MTKPTSDYATAVAAASADCRSLAEALSKRLSLPLARIDETGWDLQLVAAPTGLQLRQPGKGAPGPVWVDFVGGRAAHRRIFGGGRGQPLARAAGLKGGRTPRVLDATAGLGRDAFVFASLGCRVEMIERSPIIAALLQDGIDRAFDNDQTRSIARRMELQCSDSIEYLNELSPADAPDIIYMDPMYPQREKSALVKKEMILFRRLVGDDADSSTLLEAAREHAIYRVVVKRPAGSCRLGGAAPSMSISSTNTRYDVYVNRGFGEWRSGRDSNPRPPA